MINTIYIICGYYGIVKVVIDYSDIKNVVLTMLNQSFFIGSGIFPTFWCMFPFFLASVLCYLNSREGVLRALESLFKSFSFTIWDMYGLPFVCLEL